MIDNSPSKRAPKSLRTAEERQHAGTGCVDVWPIGRQRGTVGRVAEPVEPEAPPSPPPPPLLCRGAPVPPHLPTSCPPLPPSCAGGRLSLLHQQQQYNGSDSYEDVIRRAESLFNKIRYSVAQQVGAVGRAGWCRGAGAALVDGSGGGSSGVTKGREGMGDRITWLPQNVGSALRMLGILNMFTPPTHVLTGMRQVPPPRCLPPNPRLPPPPLLLPPPPPSSDGPHHAQGRVPGARQGAHVPRGAGRRVLTLGYRLHDHVHR